MRLRTLRRTAVGASALALDTILLDLLPSGVMRLISPEAFLALIGEIHGSSLVYFELLQILLLAFDGTALHSRIGSVNGWHFGHQRLCTIFSSQSSIGTIWSEIKKQNTNTTYSRYSPLTNCSLKCCYWCCLWSCCEVMRWIWRLFLAAFGSPLLLEICCPLLIWPIVPDAEVEWLWWGCTLLLSLLVLWWWVTNFCFGSLFIILIFVRLTLSSLLKRLVLDFMFPIPCMPPIMFLPTRAPELDSRILLLKIPV